MREWVKALVILPFNALVVIPFVILYFSGYELQFGDVYALVVGGVLLVCGLFFAGWTMRLFATIGKGTAAPWSPPKKLVVSGPYCYVRNPMITSVLMMLLAEALILNSIEILIWFGVFFIINSIYFPLAEEKGLEKRFGKDYKVYKQNVPRWVPRFSAWKQGKKK